MTDFISERCNCPECVRIRNERFKHVAGCYCSMCCPPQPACSPAAPGQGALGMTIFIPPRETPDEKKAKEIERMWRAVRAASGA